MPATPLMDPVISSLNTTICKESALNTNANSLSIDKDMYNQNQIEEILTSFYFNLERNYSKSKMVENIQQFINILNNIDENKKAEYCSYLILLLFHTRDIKYGKGERKVSRELFLCLYEYFPKTLELLVSKIPDYGYWRDLSEILLDISVDLNKYTTLKEIILNTFIEQLRIDWDNYELWEYDRLAAIKEGKTFNRILHISILAKWIPKENGHFDKRIKVSKDLAKILFPNDFKVKFNIAMAKYRNMVVKLNSAINTTEILMCEKKFSQIQFKIVPGKCLNKYKCAFLNIVPNSTNEQIRCIDNNDRNECRKNFLVHTANISSTKINTQLLLTPKLFIHDIVERLMPQNISKYNNEEIEMLKLYWNNISHEYKNLVDNNQITLSDGIILSDMSGSMSGKPITISISAALFISSFLKEPFSDRFISFDTNPNWCTINKSASLVDKINMILKTPWRGFADLEKAYHLILDKAIINKLNPQEIPKWFLIITDMPFNKATRNSEWTEIYDHIEQRFIQIGLNTVGKPYTPPEMIYWNVRGHQNNRLPTYSKESNLILINGFNVSIFTEILKKQNIQHISQWTNIKCLLDDERYLPIMDVIKLTAETPYFRKFAINSDTEILVDTSSPMNVSKYKNNTNKNGFFSYFSNYFSN